MLIFDAARYAATAALMPLTPFFDDSLFSDSRQMVSPRYALFRLSRHFDDFLAACCLPFLRFLSLFFDTPLPLFIAVIIAAEASMPAFAPP